MRRSLKTASSDYFTSFQLNDDALIALHERVNQPVEKTGRFYGKQIFAGFMAGILLAIFTNLILQRTQPDPLLQIASEVAQNHLHQNPLEIASNDFSEVQQYFSGLDFAIQPSSYYAGDDKILGGRYCSLKGVKAAQIRLNTSSQPATLYQVAYDRQIFGDLPDIDKGEQPVVRYANGIKVKIWVEKGLLMSSAEQVSR